MSKDCAFSPGQVAKESRILLDTLLGFVTIRGDAYFRTSVLTVL